MVKWQHVIMDIECSGPQQTGVVGKNIVEKQKIVICTTGAKGQYSFNVLLV